MLWLFATRRIVLCERWFLWNRRLICLVVDLAENLSASLLCVSLLPDPQICSGETAAREDLGGMFGINFSRLNVFYDDSYSSMCTSSATMASQMENRDVTRRTRCLSMTEVGQCSDMGSKGLTGDDEQSPSPAISSPISSSCKSGAPLHHTESDVGWNGAPTVDPGAILRNPNLTADSAAPPERQTAALLRS